MGCGGGQGVSVLAFYPTIQVRILLKPTVVSVKFVFEMNENNQKEARVGTFKKKLIFA